MLDGDPALNNRHPEKVNGDFSGCWRVDIGEVPRVAGMVVGLIPQDPQVGTLLPPHPKIASSFFQDLMERDQICEGKTRPKRAPFLPTGIRWTGCAGGNVRRTKKVGDKRLKCRNTCLKQDNKCSLSVFLQGGFLGCSSVRPVPGKAAGTPHIDVI